MLNVDLVQKAMAMRGLNQAALAQACGVSREAVSKWFAGESLPRPAKLRSLAETLGLDLAGLQLAVANDPVIAYRTHLREPLSDRARAAALEMGRHFRQLQAFMELRQFTPRVLENPSDDEGAVRRAVEAVRGTLQLAADQSPTWLQLIEQLRLAGADIAPVLWGREKVGHENALTIHLPDGAHTWVVVSLSACADDFKYWLAHELGHCLTLHRLTEEGGERFAERFAQLLVFPDALADHCLQALRMSAEPLAKARDIARFHGVSVVTVVKSVDRLALARGEAATGMASEAFYETWSQERALQPTVASELFGTDAPTVDLFVQTSSTFFQTSVFDAIGRLQVAQGGHSPAFVSALLNIDLPQARELSMYLSQPQA